MKFVSKLFITATFVVAFFLNYNINKTANGNDLILSNIAALSSANAEDAYEECCNPVWENVSCSCNGTTYTYMEKK